MKYLKIQISVTEIQILGSLKRRCTGLVLGYVLLSAISMQAYSYDDYSFNHNATSNQYQTNFQIQSYNNFSPKLDFFQLNFRDDFMKNPAYTAVIKGHESNGGMKDFLADKVAPNLNVQNFVGSEVKYRTCGFKAEDESERGWDECNVGHDVPHFTL